MTWITDNWIGILLGIAFIGFHLFGHRGHGGGGHSHGSSTPVRKVDQPNAPEQNPTLDPPGDKAPVAEVAGPAEEPAAAPPASRGHQH